MNSTRILRVANCLFLLIGYQLHWFEAKTRRFRLSPWTVLHFGTISILYVICFAHHFERSAILQLLHDVSPFLRHLIRIQLIMGLKIFLFGVYELRMITRAANALATILPQVFARRFTRGEAYAHTLLFSTLIIGLGIVLYVAWQVKFELPPLDYILVFMALCLPHFGLGGALKFYNVGVWLLREQLMDLDNELERIVPIDLVACETKSVANVENGKAKDDANALPIKDLNATNAVATTECSKQDWSAPLQQLNRQLTELARTQRVFNAALQRQLVLLVLLNSNCLLAGTYTRVYYETTWHLVFLKRTQNIFQATNCGIFILIFWDYLCLCVTQALFEKVKLKFTKRVYAIMKQRQRYTESTSFILTDMHDVLKNGFNFKIGGVRVNLCSFLVLQLFVGLVIALIVVYHYLDDQILALSERLDGAEDDEE